MISIEEFREITADLLDELPQETEAATPEPVKNTRTGTISMFLLGAVRSWDLRPWLLLLSANR